MERGKDTRGGTENESEPDEVDAIVVECGEHDDGTVRIADDYASS